MKVRELMKYLLETDLDNEVKLNKDFVNHKRGFYILYDNNGDVLITKSYKNEGGKDKEQQAKKKGVTMSNYNHEETVKCYEGKN